MISCIVYFELDGEEGSALLLGPKACKGVLELAHCEEQLSFADVQMLKSSLQLEAWV